MFPRTARPQSGLPPLAPSHPQSPRASSGAQPGWREAACAQWGQDTPSFGVVRGAGAVNSLGLPSGPGPCRGPHRLGLSPGLGSQSSGVQAVPVNREVGAQHSLASPTVTCKHAELGLGPHSTHPKARLSCHGAFPATWAHMGLSWSCCRFQGQRCRPEGPRMGFRAAELQPATALPEGGMTVPTPSGLAGCRHRHTDNSSRHCDSRLRASSRRKGASSVCTGGRPHLPPGPHGAPL